MHRTSANKAQVQVHSSCEPATRVCLCFAFSFLTHATVPYPLTCSPDGLNKLIRAGQFWGRSAETCQACFRPASDQKPQKEVDTNFVILRSDPPVRSPMTAPQKADNSSSETFLYAESTNLWRCLNQSLYASGQLCAEVCSRQGIEYDALCNNLALVIPQRLYVFHQVQQGM